MAKLLHARSLATLLAFTVLLTSCGSSDSDDDAISASTPTTAAADSESSDAISASTPTTAADDSESSDTISGVSAATASEPTSDDEDAPANTNTEADDDTAVTEPTGEPDSAATNDGADDTAEAATDAEGVAGSPIVLVHGAWQDGSSWAHVQQALEASGRTVSTVTLPGRDGIDAGAQTLDGYRDTVIAEVETHGEPVILVGHSFGGMTISAVAEAIPHQIESLVYVAAYLPADGDTLAGLAAQDNQSVLGQSGNLIISGDPAVASVPRESFAEFFCPDCDPTQAEAVTTSAISEPAGPLLQPVALTAENFGVVPKTYVQTAQDIVLGPELQEAMFTRAGVDEVAVLETGHAPYITAADELADLIHQLDT